MNVKRVLLPNEGNELHPLPSDYETLTREGKRLARVNATRQWNLPAYAPRSELRGQVYCRCIDFFDRYYLWPELDETGDVFFDPLFYDLPPLPRAPFHWLMARAAIMHRLVVGVAPRGSAKSMSKSIEALMQLISWPGYSITYSTLGQEMAEARGEQIRNQCYHNERIFDDFAPEYGGRMKPSTDAGQRGVKRFMLTNRSWFMSTSIESKQRGLRPRKYWLDDPEYDPKGSTSLEAIRQWMERYLFWIVLPMIQRPGTSAEWWGTFVTKRHYLHHAMEVKEQVIDGATKLVATDRRFKRWKRIYIPAEYKDSSGVLHSCWPQMWPINADERSRLFLSEEVQTLEEIREEIGEPAYNSEYLGKPGEGGAAFFPSLTREAHAWWFEQADEHIAADPKTSMTLVCWIHEGRTHRVPLASFLRDSFVFQTMDTSYTANVDSDSKVATTMAWYKGNILFVLDMFSAICVQTHLLGEAFDRCEKWGVHVLCPEVVKESYSLWDDIVDEVTTRTARDDAYIPGIQKIKPGFASKQSKIAVLLRRFQHGLIKLPMDQMKARVHPWDRLEEQIIGFNPYADAGGLRHDDELDTVAMSTQVIRGAAPSRGPEETKKKEDPMESLMAGKTHDEGGNDLITALAGRLTVDQVDMLIEQQKKRPLKTIA